MGGGFGRLASQTMRFHAICRVESHCSCDSEKSASRRRAFEAERPQRGLDPTGEQYAATLLLRFTGWHEQRIYPEKAVRQCALHVDRTAQ
jgi:hypothetical protein